MLRGLTMNIRCLLIRFSKDEFIGFAEPSACFEQPFVAEQKYRVL